MWRVECRVRSVESAESAKGAEAAEKSDHHGHRSVEFAVWSAECGA